jgi:hypothetical protein
MADNLVQFRSVWFQQCTGEVRGGGVLLSPSLSSHPATCPALYLTTLDDTPTKGTRCGLFEQLHRL